MCGAIKSAIFTVLNTSYW